MKINMSMTYRVEKRKNTLKHNVTHQICTANDASLTHEPGTCSTLQSPNIFLKKRHVKAFNNGSTHGCLLLQAVSNKPRTAETTTCMTFEDTLHKYYPKIVVLRLWARCVPSLLWKRQRVTKMEVFYFNISL